MVHDHSGSVSWIKVLEGTIEETKYQFSEESESLQPLASVPYSVDSVIYNDEKVIHKVQNISHEAPAVSLHIYSPPYENCTCFDPNTTVSLHLNMNHLPLV